MFLAVMRILVTPSGGASVTRTSRVASWDAVVAVGAEVGVGATPVPGVGVGVGAAGVAAAVGEGSGLDVADGPTTAAGGDDQAKGYDGEGEWK